MKGFEVIFLGKNDQNGQAFKPHKDLPTAKTLGQKIHDNFPCILTRANIIGSITKQFNSKVNREYGIMLWFTATALRLGKTDKRYNKASSYLLPGMSNNSITAIWV